MNGVNYASDAEGDIPDVRLRIQRCWELRRRILVIAAAIAAVIFCVVFWLKCQYSSDGLLRAPRKFAEYNAQKATFWDRDALRRYLEANKRADDPAAQQLLGALNERFVQAHVRTVLPLSKDDLRYITDPKTATDTAGILGFSIAFQDRQSPEKAQEQVQLMGDFIKDAMLSEDLLETINLKAGEARAKKQQIDNLIIQKNVALAQAGSRLNAARAIASKYPEASKMEARQLLSTGDDSQASRYLSPMAQVVGVETEIADLKSQLMLLERDAAQNTLRMEFYERIQQRSREALTGSALLAAFVEAGQAVLKDHDLQDDKVREVYNEIMLIAEQMRNKHLTEPRFVSGPRLQSSRSGPNMLVLALLSLFGGGVLASVAVLMLDGLRRPVEASGKAALLEKKTGLVDVRDQLRVRAN